MTDLSDIEKRYFARVDLKNHSISPRDGVGNLLIQTHEDCVTLLATVATLTRERDEARADNAELLKWLGDVPLPSVQKDAVEFMHRFYIWFNAMDRAALRADHPGASLLSELSEARSQRRTPGTVEVCMTCKMLGPWQRCQDIMSATPPHLCPMKSLPPFPDNSAHGNDAVEYIARVIASGTSDDPGCERKTPMEIANEVVRFVSKFTSAQPQKPPPDVNSLNVCTGENLQQTQEETP